MDSSFVSNNTAQKPTDEIKQDSQVSQLNYVHQLSDDYVQYVVHGYIRHIETKCILYEIIAIICDYYCVNNKVIYLLIQSDRHLDGNLDIQNMRSFIMKSTPEVKRYGRYWDELNCRYWDELKKERHIYMHLFDILQLKNGKRITEGKVLESIELLCQFAKYHSNKNPKNSIVVYYTGHGAEKTGDWVLCDKDLALKQIINIFKRYKKDISSFNIIADCCYSGNWALELEKYKTEFPENEDYGIIRIDAASWPQDDGWSDTYRGGFLTQYIAHPDDKANEHLKRCQYDSKNGMVYFAGDELIFFAGHTGKQLPTEVRKRFRLEYRRWTRKLAKLTSIC
eukprot:119422_1